VLASREELGPAVVSRLEQVAVRLAPLVETWLAEEEIARLQRLVRSLGMRMFGAIDGERQRIARDLHDHLAQLIAASRIALAADPQGASGILKQLDEALRLRVRELRPATLGRSTLREALRYEIHRMGDAGIKARLLHPEWTKRLPRAIQELCYQVSREAISNVIRHAGATRVEMTTERRRGRVFLRIDDNGKGLSVRTDATNGGGHGAGMGPRGMAERLELMGGQLKLERLAGVTRLTAEIPER
jgi:two-component system sensor histidine kinase DesK